VKPWSSGREGTVQKSRSVATGGDRALIEKRARVASIHVRY
jgi:hypothetical protein